MMQVESSSGNDASGGEGQSLLQSTSYGSVQDSSNAAGANPLPTTEGGGDEEETTLSIDNEEVEEDCKHTGTIGMVGSISIMVNSLTGPAMLNLPSLFQAAGLIPTTVTIIFICLLSNLCSLHMSNVISKVPGNSNFQKEIEYSEAFHYFWGQKAFVFTQISFFFCITCLNIASIVDTAQVIDQVIAHSRSSGTFALQYNSTAAHENHGYSSGFGIDETTTTTTTDGGGIDEEKRSYSFDLVRWTHKSCSEYQMLQGHCLPFDADEAQDSTFLLTAGYVLSCIMFLPMSLMDLKENTKFQVVGFVVLLVLSIQFIVTFIQEGLDMSNVSLWGEDWSDLFGVVLFNFAVVICIPAWLYEKDKSVNVNQAFNQSSWLAFFLYVLVGGLGALSIPNVSENMLSSMLSGGFGPTTEKASEIFTFFIIGLGIPLFSVLGRLNLTGSGLCSEFVANLLAVYFPWGISWLFYAGSWTTELLGWGGVLFSSIIVFLAPLLLALHTVLEFEEEGSISVYGGSKFFESKRSQVVALSILLLLTIASIIFAFFGELT